MDTAFHLRTSRPELEPNFTFFNACPQLPNILDPKILERMLHPGIQIRQERLHAAFILDVARYALGNLDSGGFGEVPGGSGIFVWC